MEELPGDERRGRSRREESSGLRIRRPRGMNEPMDIFESTRRYENWMRRHVQLISSQLVAKHAMMKDDPFAFFRGTYYRWVQLWRSTVPKTVQAEPTVLAVGDLHVDSFGTWRDVEGR